MSHTVEGVTQEIIERIGGVWQASVGRCTRRAATRIEPRRSTYGVLVGDESGDDVTD